LWAHKTFYSSGARRDCRPLPKMWRSNDGKSLKRRFTCSTILRAVASRRIEYRAAGHNPHEKERRPIGASQPFPALLALVEVPFLHFAEFVEVIDVHFL